MGTFFMRHIRHRLSSTALDRLAQGYDRPLAVECLPLANFYPAEEYHQKYLEKNPNGYCHIHF